MELCVGYKVSPWGPRAPPGWGLLPRGPRGQAPPRGPLGPQGEILDFGILSKFEMGSKHRCSRTTPCKNQTLIFKHQGGADMERLDLMCRYRPVWLETAWDPNRRKSKPNMQCCCCCNGVAAAMPQCNCCSAAVLLLHCCCCCCCNAAAAVLLLLQCCCCC